MKRLLPLLLLLSIVFGNAVHGDPARVPPGMSRYRVTIDVAGTDELPRLIRQLAAMCRGRLETSPDSGPTFVVVASDAGAGVLRSDSRVVRVEPLSDGPGSGVTAIAATGIWATGTYAYDGAGNISSIGRSSTAVGQRFVYDAYGRLTSGMAADQKQTYTYDRFGNIRTIARGTLREGGALGKVLGGIQSTFKSGAPKSAEAALEAVANGAEVAGMKPGTLVKATDGAKYVLQNVGDVKTFIYKTGEVIVKKGDDVLVRYIPK